MFARFKAYINLKRRKDEPRAGAAAILTTVPNTFRRMKRETCRYKKYLFFPRRHATLNRIRIMVSTLR